MFPEAPRPHFHLNSSLQSLHVTPAAPWMGEDAVFTPWMGQKAVFYEK